MLYLVSQIFMKAFEIGEKMQKNTGIYVIMYISPFSLLVLTL